MECSVVRTRRAPPNAARMSGDIGGRGFAAVVGAVMSKKPDLLSLEDQMC